jgi:hypothetical protein
MAIDHGHGMGADRNPSVEYDKTDLGAKGIIVFFVVLGIFAIAMHLVVLGLYAGMTRFAGKHEPEVSPLATQTYTPRDGILTNTANVNTQQFPEPRLLRHLSEKGELSITGREPGEMTKFLLEESAALTAKPWLDAQGNIHLPIAQAMTAVLPRLPVRAGAAEPPNYPGAAREYSYPPAQAEGNSTAGK